MEPQEIYFLYYTDGDVNNIEAMFANESIAGTVGRMLMDNYPGREYFIAPVELKRFDVSDAVDESTVYSVAEKVVKL